MRKSTSSPQRVSALTMWQARTRRRSRLPRSSIIFTIRRNTPTSARRCRRVFCLSALREPVKPCSRRLSRVRQMCRSSRCRALNSSKCSSAWAQAKSVTFLSRPRKKRPASSSSTKLTRSAKNATISYRQTMSASRRSTSCSQKWTDLKETTASSSSLRRTGPSLWIRL